MLNPIAPPGIQGIDPSAPMGYFDVPFGYTYNVTLTALQAIIGDTVSIFTEADFLLRGLIMTRTGQFSVQFQDGQGYYLQSAQVLSTNLPNTPGDPFPIFPEVLYPAGGKIYINITDISNAQNAVQILFLGVSRYKIAGA